MHEDWGRILKVAKDARITMVIGASDTGKTTLVKYLATAISNAGHTCGIIDADMGQSEIGPPTTIGLGGIYEPIKSIHQVEVSGIYFVGSISPKGYLLPTVIGTKKMVDRAVRMGFDRILIDTTGLVQGPLGQTLKGYKIELIEPDLLIFLQRQSECMPIIKRFRSTSQPQILVLCPSHQVSTKSPAKRKEYRERALISYFSNRRIKKLDLKNLCLVDFDLLSGVQVSEKELNVLSQRLDKVVLWAGSFDDEFHIVTIDPITSLEQKYLWDYVKKDLVFTYTLGEFVDILVGCYNMKGECFSLGIVRKIDFFAQEAEVEIAEDREGITGIKFSRYKINQDGSGYFLQRKIAISQESLG
ncbi:MAG: Clp1/GlmU family protein [Pseudomonadota bacterium]